MAECGVSDLVEDARNLPPTWRGRATAWIGDISDPADLERLLAVDPGTWQEEAGLAAEYFELFGRHLPEQLRDEHDALVERLKNAS